MKKFFGYSSIVAGVLVLTFGTILLYRLTQFRTEVERLKNEGRPVSIADLNQPASEDGKQALALFNRLQTQLSAFEKEMFIDEEVLFRPVDAEMIDRFHELCDAYPDVYPLIDQLSNKSDISTELEGHSQEYIDVLLDQVQQFRSISRALVWKTRILAAQQKPDEAVETGLQVFRLSQLVDQHPTIISYLVASALRGQAINTLHDVVTRQAVSAPQMKQLNETLEQLDSSDAYVESLRTERPIGIESLSEMGLLATARNGVGYLDVVEDEIRNADKESYEQTFAVEQGFSSLINGALGKSILPAFQQTRLADARVRSRLRAFRIINALEMQNDPPPTPVTQAYLVQIGVPEKMTVDTMNGEPMNVKLENDRWIVYSVGADLEDNGGSADGMQDFSLGANSSE